MINHYEVSIYFQNIEYQLQKNILQYYFHCNFSSLNLERSLTYLSQFTGFYDIAQRYKLFKFVPVFKLWKFFIFLIIIHIFFISFCISIDRMTLSALTPFSTINNMYQYQLRIQNILWSFIKLLAKLIWDLKKFLLDLIPKFLGTFS